MTGDVGLRLADVLWGLAGDSCIRNFLETAGENPYDIRLLVGDPADARDSIATRRHARDLDFKAACDLSTRAELVAITKDIAAFSAYQAGCKATRLRRLSGLR